MGNGARAESASCPVCRAAHVRPFRRPAGALYYRCRSCGALFQFPVPDPSEMLRYAETEYAGGGYREYVAAREMKLEHFRRRMTVLRPRLPPGRLLDVGCSCGYFLEIAAAEGYDVRGLEFSENAIAAAIPGIRHRIRREAIDRLSIDAVGRFDVITAFDIIEHLAQPLEFLAAARRLLTPGGVIAISTPDADHWLGALMRSHWPMLQPMQHLTIFSRRALGLALQREGFQDVRLEVAHKVVSVDYLVGQLKTVSPVAHAAFAAGARLLPSSALSRYRSVNIGEVLATAVTGSEAA